MVLDSKGSLVCPDLLVRLWAQIFLDLWGTPASLDWMESMVFRVLQVLPGLLVQAQPRETEGTLGSQASPARPAGKEIQAAPEAPDFLAVPVSKENEVRPASAEVLASRVSLVTLVTMETKELRDFKGVLVVRGSLESRCRCHRQTSSDPMERWAFPVRSDAPVPPENPDSPECRDVQVQRVVLGLWVNWAGLDHLVCPDLLVTPDPLASPDPPENKVSPVTPVVPALPAASAAVTASATLW